MTIVLRYLPRRLVPLYDRDWRGTDALFRIGQKKLLRMIKAVRLTYNTLYRIGRLTPDIKRNLKKLKIDLFVRYLSNMIVEVPPRSPRMHYERQSFANFKNESCSGTGYLGVSLSEKLRFRSVEDLHRLVFIAFIYNCSYLFFGTDCVLDFDYLMRSS